jgi:hypothetical protein
MGHFLLLPIAKINTIIRQILRSFLLNYIYFSKILLQLIEPEQSSLVADLFQCLAGNLAGCGEKYLVPKKDVF